MATLSVADPSEPSLVNSLNLGLIDKMIWLLLGAFIIMGFSDSMTTLIAYSTAGGFYEVNRFASALFRMGLGGFLLADAIKLLPVVPLAYMAALRTSGGSTDFEVGLLKIAALVVLGAGDAYLSWVVLANNIPNLIGFLYS